MTTHSVPSTEELVIRRRFRARAEALYDAWLSPEILKIFMGSEGAVVHDATVDARVGGAYAITMASCDEGEPITVRGVYRVLDRPREIVCTWGWEEDNAADNVETELRLQFEPHGEETELTLTHVRFRNRDQRERHQRGWTDTLTKLGRYVER